MRSDRLKQLRTAKGYTQTDLAGFLDTSQSQIKRWESGQVIPSSDALGKMARFFGVTADYLLGLVDHPQEQITMSDLDPLEQRLIRLIRSGALTKAMSVLLTFDESEQPEDE